MALGKQCAAKFIYSQCEAGRAPLCELFTPQIRLDSPPAGGYETLARNRIEPRQFFDRSGRDKPTAMARFAVLYV